ncbi:MAG: glycogen/starch synthase [Gammaproteobacteria bacterium]
MNITMLAAEYGGAAALRCTPLASTIERLAHALAQCGASVTIITPGYGVVDGPALEQISVNFGGTDERVEVIEASNADDVRHIALEHVRFQPQGAGRVYCDDGNDAPFATDAGKFAFFSAASATYLSSQPVLPDAVHVHDWPGGLFFALREYDPAHLALRTVRCVFSLHSSEIQGRRPLAFHESSLRSWFADLPLPRRAVVDPEYDDCVNPVATAMRLADAVALPSVSYVDELCADDASNLSALAHYQRSRGALMGIDAGATPRERPVRRTAWTTVRQQLHEHLRGLIAGAPLLRSAHFLCDQTLELLPARRPSVVASLLGPFDDNGLHLLRQSHTTATSVLDAMLATLRGGERLVALGDGTAAAESFLTAVAARQPRFVYLQGNAGAAADWLLRAADFHVVLPHFAPGAAAALTALNLGRPCLVHRVGGLRDAVEEGFNGWHTDAAQDAVVAAFARACDTKRAGGKPYNQLCSNAATSGTPWPVIAKRFLDQLYRATVT